jgi:flagellar L-ring protein precursor FlgH
MNTSRLLPCLWVLSSALGLAACSSDPPLVVPPYLATPTQRPAQVERVRTGSLYPTSGASLFSGRQKPRNVGDVLKVDIAESLKVNNSVKSDLSRSSAFSSKGDGKANGSNWLSGLINQDISGAGKTNFSAEGSASNDSSFKGQIAASVINVLPNGNLLIAGERAIGQSGDVNILRFSGLVDPADIKDGNIVVSSDVVNARLEILGKGDMADTTRRNWIQRLVNSNLSAW